MINYLIWRHPLSSTIYVSLGRECVVHYVSTFLRHNSYCVIIYAVFDSTPTQVKTTGNYYVIITDTPSAISYLLRI